MCPFAGHHTLRRSPKEDTLTGFERRAATAGRSKGPPDRGLLLHKQVRRGKRRALAPSLAVRRALLANEVVTHA